MTRRGWAALVLGGALAVGPALTGCSGGDDNNSNTQTQKVEPGGGLQTMGADGLPTDFPRKEVPLVTGGEVTSVEKGGRKDPGYAVAILIDGSPERVVTKAVALLKGAGWQSRTSLAGSRPPVQVLRKGAEQVIITNSVSGGQTLLSYAISLPGA